MDPKSYSRTLKPESYSDPPPENLRPGFGEWRCNTAAALGQTFYEMPNDCRKVFHNETWKVRFVKKQGDATAISKTSLGHESLHAFDQAASGSDIILSRTRRSTDKPDGESGECDWDKDGSPDCAVTVTAETPMINMSYTGWTEPSVNTKDDLVRIELPSDFRDRISKRLKNGECNTFIKKLIAKASEYTVTNKREVVKRSSLSEDLTGHELPYATDGHSLLRKMSGFRLVDNLIVNGRPAGGTTEGSIPKGNAGALINSHWRRSVGDYKGYASSMEKHSQNYYVNIAIHEMLHQAGYYFGDELLAQALLDLGEFKTPSDNTLGNTPSDRISDSVKKYCGKE